MHYSLDNFTRFLGCVDLELYRNQYSRIKTVEMDLPRNIQALDTIYQFYWDEGVGLNNDIPPSYDECYESYWRSCNDEIRRFWNSTGFGLNCDCFTRGLKARIYRTWASLITQIHAGYVAETVFGIGNVEQSTVLDHRKIDLLIHYRGQELKIQIKKESHRPEIERMYNNIPVVENDGFFYIWYVVPKLEYYNNNPYYVVGARRGELRDSLKSFVHYNPNFGTLDMLNNGFVIFTTGEFEAIRRHIDEQG